MMHSLTHKTATRDKSKVVRKHIARSLVGQAVDLLVDTHTIVHGVVTGVMTESGCPKLVVGGTHYDLNQILTATPVAFDHQLQPQH